MRISDKIDRGFLTKLIHIIIVFLEIESSEYKQFLTWQDMVVIFTIGLQSRTDRIVFKLFGKEPNDFPLVLRKQVHLLLLRSTCYQVCFSFHFRRYYLVSDS